MAAPPGLLSRIRQWVRLKTRPAQPGPDSSDLNLPPQTKPQGRNFNQGMMPDYQDLERISEERKRRLRNCEYRSGPWQQK